MFNRDKAIGWIGNIAVFALGNGYILVDWKRPTSKRLIINHHGVWGYI